MTFLEPQKELPVYGKYDTVVVGGGFAGVAAALAAARGGNKVLLCEREFMLGGLGTAGLVTIYLPLCDGMGHQVSFGIVEELFKLSISKGWEARYPKAWLEGGTFEEKAQTRYLVRYNAHVCAVLYEQLLLKEGIDLLFGTVVCGTSVENGCITHVMIENKGGRSAVEVGNVIDCSGDADICALAGENTAMFGPGVVSSGWYYYCDDGKYDLQYVGVDCTKPERCMGLRRYGGVDGKELSDYVIESHDNMLKHFLGKGDLSENHMLATMATIPQVRMTRRLASGVELDLSDDKRYFEDSVGLFPNWRKKGPVYELPYATLHGKKIKNLATAGRCFSVTDAMWDISRVIPVCAVSGEAVGTAAAMGKNFDEIDVSALQNKLRENGVKLHVSEVL